MGTNCLELEKKHCFDYFYDNFARGEKTFGLMPDMVPAKYGESSVAADGFMLAAMIVGAEEGYITRSECEKICLSSLKTHQNLERKKGFYYHFYNLSDAQRSRKCELSIIDTGLFLAGALTAGAYFGGQIMDIARQLYLDCDWEYFYWKDKKYFYMAEFPSGLTGHWDVYAEQLILYFLAAGSPKGEGIAVEAYNSFRRLKGSYGGYEYIYSWFGSLFTHQFSHAFLDLKGLKDADGIDWFENSVKATLANRAYCIDNAASFKGYGKDGWGLTSCLTPYGYRGHIGVIPSGNDNSESISDGTIAVCGAIGSLPFTPKESLSALEHFYKKPQLIAKYGLTDAYNEDIGWYCDSYISIDKGISLLMIANYQKQTVWRYFNAVPEIKKAYKTLQFRKENE